LASTSVKITQIFANQGAARQWLIRWMDQALRSRITH
jgi:hypothetical protein